RLAASFICNVCKTRNIKTMSKHAYEKGVVIIQCDGCKNRHLIADHLGWFQEPDPRPGHEGEMRAPGTIEEILQRRG
ncbi:hypothetical protein CXG81DRAFT_4104, partial [Caulochytrium protostelioides]